MLKKVANNYSYPKPVTYRFPVSPCPEHAPLPRFLRPRHTIRTPGHPLDRFPVSPCPEHAPLIWTSPICKDSKLLHIELRLLAYIRLLNGKLQFPSPDGMRASTPFLLHGS
jgi:hypothetical protein